MTASQALSALFGEQQAVTLPTATFVTAATDRAGAPLQLASVSIAVAAPLVTGARRTTFEYRRA